MERPTARTLGIIERMQIVGRVQARALPCGCRIGRYVTLGRDLLTVVDEPHDTCRNRAHQTDVVIGEDLREASSVDGARGDVALAGNGEAA